MVPVRLKTREEREQYYRENHSHEFCILCGEELAVYRFIGKGVWSDFIGFDRTCGTCQGIAATIMRNYFVDEQEKKKKIGNRITYDFKKSEQVKFAALYQLKSILDRQIRIRKKR